MLPDADAAIDAVYRSDCGRIIAILIGRFDDFDVAEEAAQEALVAAAARLQRLGLIYLRDGDKKTYLSEDEATGLARRLLTARLAV